MIFTEEEFLNYASALEVYLGSMLVELYSRLSIVLDEVQYNRWLLINDCCDANFHPEVAYIYGILGTLGWTTDDSVMDKWFLIAAWVLYGDPNPDYLIPWEDSNYPALKLACDGSYSANYSRQRLLEQINNYT